MSKILRTLEKVFVNLLDAHAPRKTKILRVNHKAPANRIFVKPLWSVLKLKTKQTELNVVMILLNMRNNKIW